MTSSIQTPRGLSGPPSYLLVPPGHGVQIGVHQGRQALQAEVDQVRLPGPVEHQQLTAHIVQQLKRHRGITLDACRLTQYSRQVSFTSYTSQHA